MAVDSDARGSENDVKSEGISSEIDDNSEIEGEPGSSGSNNDIDIKSQQKKKRGIVYLSTIPKYMNVIKVREIFSDYGKLGRVYLQPAVPS